MFLELTKKTRQTKETRNSEFLYARGFRGSGVSTNQTYFKFLERVILNHALNQVQGLRFHDLTFKTKRDAESREARDMTTFCSLNVRKKFSDVTGKNLRLFREFARKRGPFGAAVNERFVFCSVGINCRPKTAPPINEGAAN